MNTYLKRAGIGLLASLGVTAIVGLRKHNADLRERIAHLAGRNGLVDALREENERLSELLGQVRKDEADAGRIIRIHLQQAQRDLADLEKHAMERREEHAARVAAEAGNRDPEQGMTRLDFFQNAGRGSPAAALQTLVWSVLKGDDATLASSLSLTEPGREKIAALLARLSETERKKFPFPESVAALAIMGDILKTEALEIKSVVMTDASHATLALRRRDSAKEAKIPMIRTAGGWQIVVPEKAVDTIIRRMSDSPPGAAKN